MCSYVMQIRVPDSPGLLDFAIGLVDSNHHLPDGQVKFFWELKLQNYCRASRSHKGKICSTKYRITFHARHKCVKFFLWSSVHEILK